jgi:hypothetical protein
MNEKRKEVSHARPARKPLIVADTTNAPPGEPLKSHPLAWWMACNLRMTMSRPVVFQLETPEGKRLNLAAEQMLSPRKIRAAMLDGIGEIVPLPERQARAFLRDMVARLVERAERT